MAWWDDIRKLIRDELSVLGPGASIEEPPTLRQAEALLARTARELQDARGRAEAARRRMQRAERELAALTRRPDQHPSFRERLEILARAVAHEGELERSFSSHIDTLTRLHQGIEEQLRHFHRDVEMARTAMAAAKLTRVAEPESGARRPGPGASDGFIHAPPAAVIDRLRRGPRGKRKP